MTESRRFWLLVSTFSVVAFVIRLAHLSETPEPTGWDGYSYVVQVQRLVERGHLHWPDSSWVWWVFALIRRCGPTEIISVKIGAAFLAALVVPASAFFGRLHGSTSTGILLGAWAASSPTLTHLVGDFPKNLAMVAPLFVLLSMSLPRSSRGESSGRRPSLALQTDTGFAALRGLMALGALALAVMAHRMGVVLIILCVLGAFVPKRAWWLVPVALIIPPFLNPEILERVSPQLTAHPSLLPFALVNLRATQWPELVEWSLSWPAIGFGLWHALEEPSRRSLFGALLVPLIICVFPWWKTDSLDLAYRLTLISPMFSVPILVLALEPKLSRTWALALLPVTLLSVTGFDPSSTPPYAGWRAMISRMPRPLPTLLIAPQGFNFLYDFETGAESMAWSPEPELDRTHIERVAWGLREGELLELLPQPAADLTRLDADTVLIREDDWERFVSRAKALGDEDLLRRINDWRNPSRVRPQTMLERHR